MKLNSFYFITMMAFAVFATGSFAAENKVVDKQQEKINLYKDASLSSLIIEQVDMSATLIPIFEQKEWIKVGNPKNGEVGWVNKEQCEKVTEAYYRPHIKSVTINITDNDASNVKPGETKIVAYRNGKQLSDKEAKELYEKMLKDQERFERQMDKLFRDSLTNFPNFMLQ